MACMTHMQTWPYKYQTYMQNSLIWPWVLSIVWGHCVVFSDSMFHSHSVSLVTQTGKMLENISKFCSWQELSLRANIHNFSPPACHENWQKAGISVEGLCGLKLSMDSCAYGKWETLENSFWKTKNVRLPVELYICHCLTNMKLNWIAAVVDVKWVAEIAIEWWKT